MISWIIDQRELGLPVSSKIIKEKAKLIQGEIDSNTSFRASSGWFQKFCKCHQLSLRRKSTLNQSDPVDIVNKVLRFLIYFQKLCEQYPTAAIWGCDETPVFFYQVHNSTFEKVGAKEIKMKSTGGDKKMVTCVLLASSDGQKAKPTVVFMGKGKSKEDKELALRTDILVLHS